MKFNKLAICLSLFSLTALTTLAQAADGYVGAGSGGPLMGTYGCVMSSNGVQFPECGQKEAEPKPEPVVKVIIDCAKCRALKKQ